MDEQKAAELSATMLGALHAQVRGGGATPYGNLADEGSARLMTKLGETGPTTEANHLRRMRLVVAYVDGWERAAGRRYPA